MAQPNGRGGALPGPLVVVFKTTFADLSKEDQEEITAAVNGQFDEVWDIVEYNWNCLRYINYGLPKSTQDRMLDGDNLRVYDITQLQRSIYNKLHTLIPAEGYTDESEIFEIDHLPWPDFIDGLAGTEKSHFVSLQRRLHKFEKVCDIFGDDLAARLKDDGFARDYHAFNDDPDNSWDGDFLSRWSKYAADFADPATVAARKGKVSVVDLYQKVIGDHWYITKANHANPNQLTRSYPAASTSHASYSMSPIGMDRIDPSSFYEDLRSDDEPPAQRRRLNAPTSMQLALSTSVGAAAGPGPGHGHGTDALVYLTHPEQTFLDHMGYFMDTLPANRVAHFARAVRGEKYGHRFADAAQ